MKQANPVLIEVCRGHRVESRHRGGAVVADTNGRIIAAWGDVHAAIFPRSAIKPLQALAWMETGAGDRLAVAPPELAMACGSHGGEPIHIACVEAWLARIDCGEDDLVCGPHPPAAAAAASDLIRAGLAPVRLHNNCSGKHAGFLTACRAAGLAAAGYEGVDHPLQQAVRQVLSEMGDAAVSAEEAAIDGCGVPTFPLSLVALATAFARLAAPQALSPSRAAAVRRITAAMIAHPVFVSGSDGFDSRVIAAGAGRVICKTGAEGVYAAALPEPGLGIALKIDDGAKRAAEAAIAALIARFGRLPPSLTAWLQRTASQPIRNTSGLPVGAVRAAAGWLDG